MDRFACIGDAALSEQAGRGADRAKKYLLVLQKMGPFGSLADKVDSDHRLIQLNVACRVARSGPSAIFRFQALSGAESPDQQKVLMDLAESSHGWRDSTTVDWNDVLTRLNTRVDHEVAVLRISDLSRRDSALADFAREMKSASAALRFFQREQNTDAVEKGIMPAGVTPALFADWLSCATMADARNLLTHADICESYRRLGQLALAIGAYREEHKSYPASLAELTPAFIEELPKDPFSGDDFRYQPKSDSYVLYSVGPNRRDDGGRDKGESPDADDIVIRAPIQPK